MWRERKWGGEVRWGWGYREGRQIRQGEREGLKFCFYILFFYLFLPHFPLLPYTSLEFYLQTRGNSFLLSPLPHPSRPFVFCVNLSLSPLPSLLSPPSISSLTARTVYLFEHEAAGCRETQNQHTVLVLKLGAKAKGWCSATNWLKRKKENERKDKKEKVSILFSVQA